MLLNDDRPSKAQLILLPAGESINEPWYMGRPLGHLKRARARTHTHTFEHTQVLKHSSSKGTGHHVILMHVHVWKSVDCAHLRQTKERDLVVRQIEGASH